MQRDVERVEEVYQALRKQNLKAMLLLMAKDVEVAQSPELPWGGTYRGHNGLKDHVAKLTEHLDYRLEMECFIDAGEQVVAVGRITGKGRTSGLEFDVPLVQVWTLRNGQITRFETYVDNATLLAAI